MESSCQGAPLVWFHISYIVHTRGSPIYAYSPLYSKVFTVNQESKYLLVMNVPSLGVVEELLALFRVYGEIEE